VIAFEAVEKSLGGRQVLRGVTLTARPRAVTFIVGPSGAGKSVLARHAAGFLRPDAGCVRLFGRDLAGVDGSELPALRRRCTFVPQGAALVDGLSLLENVALGSRAAGMRRAQARERAAELLAEVGLASEAAVDPAHCGAGVLMRAAVARALALGPEMVIFDEPTSGLEPAAARAFDRLLASLPGRGVGALVISHDPVSFLGVADELHLLLDGRIRLSGPPERFRGAEEPDVRQFVDGRAEGPLPAW
jgi:phospholipid/cholesterol/gamma-HCH transport system ATP-binding protein